MLSSVPVFQADMVTAGGGETHGYYVSFSNFEKMSCFFINLFLGSISLLGRKTALLRPYEHKPPG